MNQVNINTNKNTFNKIFLYATDKWCKKNEELKASYNDFLKLLEKDNFIMEIYNYDCNKNIRLYIDIDIDFNIGENTIFDVKTKYKQMKKQFILDNWVILDCSRTTVKSKKIKISFHLIHPKYGFKSYKILRKYVEDKYYNKYDGVDLSVYSNYQKFRAYNQSKHSSYRKEGDQIKPMKLITNHNIDQTLITGNIIEFIDYKYDNMHIDGDIDDIIVKDENFNINTVIDLLNILDKKYYNEYDSWSKVGFLLRNLANQNTEYHNEIFEIWDKFSQKTTIKNNYKKCDMSAIFHGKIRKDRALLSIGSLHFWARKSNGVEYHNIINKYKNNTQTEDEILKSRKEFIEIDGYDFHQFRWKWEGKYVESTNEWFSEFIKVVGYSDESKCYIIKYKDGNIGYSKGENLSNYYLYVKHKLKDKEIYKKMSFTACLKKFHSTNPFMYDKVVFTPNFYDNRIINLWRGFSNSDDEKDVDMSHVQIMLNHISNVIAGGNKNHYEFIIQYMAQLIQTPEDKLKVAMVLIGGQGCGKGIYTTFLTKYVIGSHHTVVVNDINKLTGRFNSIGDNKILIILDECVNCSGRKYHSTFQKLKSLITDEANLIEKKGIDAISVTNYCNYIMVSNNFYPVKMESRNRRYLILRCNNDMIGNRPYFKNLEKCLNNEVGAEFFKYLNRYDVGDYNLEDYILKSDPNDDFMGKIIGHEFEFFLSFTDGEYIKCRGEMWDKYIEFCESRNYHKKRFKTATELGTFINRHNIIAKQRKRFNVTNLWYYVINNKNIKKNIKRSHNYDMNRYDF